jgi:hypothetical protein
LLLVLKFFCIGMNFEITLSLQDMFYLHELVYLVQLPSLLWTMFTIWSYLVPCFCLLPMSVRMESWSITVSREKKYCHVYSWNSPLFCCQTNRPWQQPLCFVQFKFGSAASIWSVWCTAVFSLLTMLCSPCSRIIWRTKWQPG